MKRPGPSRPMDFLSLCVMIALTLLIITACQPSGTGVAPTGNDYPPAQTYVESSYISISSIEGLTAKSTLVVTGWADQKGNVFNMARDVNDLSKPDPRFYGIGQIYRFKIDQILKGDKIIGDSMVIFIVQA